MELKEQLAVGLQALAEAREELAAAAARELDALQELEKLDQYQIYTTRSKWRKEVEKTIGAREADLRQLAVMAYKDSEVELPGAEIVDTLSLMYQDKDAIEYCIERKMAAFLKLDTRGMDKWLKANLASPEIAKQMGLDTWAKLLKVPSARIAGDLSFLLQEKSDGNKES